MLYFGLLRCRSATVGGSPRPFGGPLGRAHLRGLRLNALPHPPGCAGRSVPRVSLMRMGCCRMYESMRRCHGRAPLYWC